MAETDTGAFGAFEGAGPHQITFTSTKNFCKQTDYEFQKGGQPLMTGNTTLMPYCSQLCSQLECLGWWEPLRRNWTISTLNKEPVFSFEIAPGWLDSQVHAVKDAEGTEIGRIQQPSFVQRMSDMWRQQMQVVVRVLDAKGYERFTLRRLGGCGQAQCPYFKKFLPDPSDLCYGRWNVNLAQWVDLDFSTVDCGTCNGVCGQAEGQPCFKCMSCRQACEYRECDVCFDNPGTVCCECNWYHCDIIGAEELKCLPPGLCQPPCRPGDGVCDAHCQDCAFVAKPMCDVYATAFKCNCFKGCEFKCCANNFKCCKFTECGKNLGTCIKLQCKECIRPLHDCPKCGEKIKTCFSKCKPQCTREFQECKSACSQIPGCIKRCITKCPHRMRQMYCGGREVRIELDVFGPDGDDGVPVCKIVYTGTSGWSCGAATLRPKYVCTINIPSVSPYYARWKNQQRGCDFVDLALLTSLAIWYDFYTVAPREYFQCAEPIQPTETEAWPKDAYYEYGLHVPLEGFPNWKEPMAITAFKWLYGDDFAFLLNPALFLNRFKFLQESPAGSLPPREVLPGEKPGAGKAAAATPAVDPNSPATTNVEPAAPSAESQPAVEGQAPPADAPAPDQSQA